MTKWIRIILAACLVAFAAHILFYFVYPDISALKKKSPSKTAFMEFRERNWRHQNKKIRITQKWVRLSQISPYAVKAVIIAEDDKFWAHEGFDFEAMQKAFEKDLKKGKFAAGGSTISQQLAKNLYLSPSKNPVRKVKEAILAWRIERTLTKKRIIELYLNVAEWGDGIFGIEAASLHHFGKHASALTAEEAARLAAALPNPLKYSASGTSKYILNRSAKIYEIMVKRGIVLPDYEEIMTTPDEANPHQQNDGIPSTSSLRPDEVKTQPASSGMPGKKRGPDDEKKYPETKSPEKTLQQPSP